MKQSYTKAEFEKFISRVSQRTGWNFSSMKVDRAPVPWDYIAEVKKYLKLTDSVLDIGTGGGERFIQLAPAIEHGLGTDIDPNMIKVASSNAKDINNMSFKVCNEKLENINEKFNVITNRHAPYNAAAISSHLLPSGVFITQQVGEKNMANVKKVLGSLNSSPPIGRSTFESNGFECSVFEEYDVEYVVKDIESLIFWLNALDMLHSDLSGSDAIANVDVLNAILDGNVSSRGFVTNEHRYLMVAQKIN